MLITRLNHLGIAVSNLEDARAFYEKCFGYSLLLGPFEDPIQRVIVCFIGTGIPGDMVFEIIEPMGEDSPLRSVLKRGGGAYHVCYEVEDIDEALQAMKDNGCLLVGRPVPAVAYRGRRIAWLYTPTRQLIELVEQIAPC